MADERFNAATRSRIKKVRTKDSEIGDTRFKRRRTISRPKKNSC
jgi:hypothetical protein